MSRLDNLEAIANGVKARFADIDINYDLSELRGYAYHTGIVFAAFLKVDGRRVAKGGRYDDVGKVFGRARGATGFDIDLKNLVRAMSHKQAQQQVVSAPVQDVAADANGRWQQIHQLRSEGYVVIEGASQQATQQLVYVDNQWKLQPL